jgi:hypothetical protein
MEVPKSPVEVTNISGETQLHYPTCICIYCKPFKPSTIYSDDDLQLLIKEMESGPLLACSPNPKSKRVRMSFSSSEKPVYPRLPGGAKVSSYMIKSTSPNRRIFQATLKKVLREQHLSSKKSQPAVLKLQRPSKVRSRRLKTGISNGVLGTPLRTLKR